MSKIFKFLFSRLVIVATLILLQAAFLLLLTFTLNDYYLYVHIFSIMISFFIVLHIINKDEEPSFKLPWLVLILLFPILGIFLYFMFANNNFSKRFQRKIKNVSSDVLDTFNKDFNRNESTKQNLEKEDKLIYTQSFYISNTTKMPVSMHTKTSYLPIGEIYFETLVQKLKQAKHFIFLEYFILTEGKMLDTIVSILAKKVKEGLDVRILYDDLGSIYVLRKDYPKYLESLGIKCVVFNPFLPILSIGHNNRDHRKIAVIDGYIGFTGGINLADEYINAIEKHGHWKDTGILLEGEAVKNLTLMFLESWNFYRPEDKDLDVFMPHIYHPEEFENDGFVQPFGDTPLDQELVSETVYINLLNAATNYVYINTPYLITNYTVLNAIKTAAKRGVDIRITVPHIPDKWYVHIITQSYYLDLLQAGVKLYEYTPGFIHAKSFVCDDKVGIIGTINLDYRSLCHHFECGVWLYQSSALVSLKQDYLETQKICIPVDEEFCKKIPWYHKLLRSFIRFFAPLM